MICHVLTPTCSYLDLELGELAHDDLFGLFEAMSAIEMMDPKMDAGMHQTTNGTKKILSFDQAVKAEKLELKKVNPEQFIGTQKSESNKFFKNYLLLP